MRFIEQLCRDLGYAEVLAPNEDGSYSLRFDPDLEISLRENGESGITMVAPLGLLPTEKSEEFMLQALVANLFGRETGGGALGLDGEGKRVIFTAILPQELNYKEFHDALEDFVNYAEAWRDETLQFASDVKG